MGNFWRESSTWVKVAIVAVVVAVIALLIALLLNIGGGSGGSPEPTPTGAVDVVDPAATPGPIASAEVPTPEVGDPTLTATTNVNIRSGPGTNYLKIGLLLEGQSAGVTGVNAEGTWWQIVYPAVQSGNGWISADFVTTSATENVPVVEAPPAPAPTVAPPVAIVDWKGEYFNNLNLEGEPALVRNDEAINFNWGTGTPAPEITSPQYSARWTNNRNMAAGTYRFTVWVSDGMRIFVDNVLVLDQWQQGPPRNFVVDVNVAAGAHEMRIEFFQATSIGLAEVAIGYLQNFPEWKAEYFGNPDQSGTAAVVRNEQGINYNWGPYPPISGLPADNYSVRWSRNATLGQGQYRYQITVEGGTRLYQDGVLLIDSWNENTLRTLQSEPIDLDGNPHDYRVDYVKRTGNGSITATYTKIQAAGPPEAVISGPTAGKVGEQLTYSANGSSVAEGSHIVSTEWDFGDGGKASGNSVQHIYDTPGEYTVKMVLTDDKGLTDEATLRAKIEQAEQPPVAVIASPDQGVVGVAVPFDGSQSTAETAIVSYDWDLGDGTRVNAVNIDHTYAAPGTYLVSLTVTDDRGLSGTATKQVAIGPGEGPVPTDTPVPEATPTETPVVEATATWTPEPAETDTPVPEETPTETPVPAETPTETPVPAETPTETPTPEVGGGQLPLQAQNWVLTQYLDSGSGALTGALGGTSVNAVFNLDLTLNGSGGCNTYNGTYTADATTLAVTAPAATSTACADPAGIMEQETAYLALLPTSATYVVAGTTLTISNGGGQPILVYNAQ